MDRPGRHLAIGLLFAAASAAGIGGLAMIQGALQSSPHSCFWLTFGIVLAAIGLVCLIALALIVGPIARRMPWAPKDLPEAPPSPPIVLRLDESLDLRMRVRDKPQDVLIGVGVDNSDGPTRTGVAINCTFPEMLSPRRSTSEGDEEAGGSWEPLDEPGQPSRLYWHDADLTLQGHGSTVFFFRLRVDGPGNFPIEVKLFGSVKAEKVGRLVVTQAEHPGDRGLLGELIAANEEVLQRSLFDGRASRLDFSEVVAGDAQARQEMDAGLAELLERKLQELPDPLGPQAESYEQRIRDRIHLYFRFKRKLVT